MIILDIIKWEKKHSAKKAEKIRMQQVNTRNWNIPQQNVVHQPQNMTQEGVQKGSDKENE